MKKSGKNRTIKDTVDNILKERRLRRLGRVIYGWTTSPYHKHCTGRVPRFRSGSGRPRTNWRETVQKDLQRLGLCWAQAYAASLRKCEILHRKNVADDAKLGRAASASSHTNTLLDISTD